MRFKLRSLHNNILNLLVALFYISDTFMEKEIAQNKRLELRGEITNWNDKLRKKITN